MVSSVWTSKASWRWFSNKKEHEGILKEIQFSNCHAAAGGERKGFGIWLSVQGTHRPLQATQKGSRMEMFKGPRLARLSQLCTCYFVAGLSWITSSTAARRLWNNVECNWFRETVSIPRKKYAALAISNYIIKHVIRSLRTSLHLKRNSWQAGHP